MPGVMDHGLSLVHDMGGEPRNYLHEVSFRDSDHVAKMLLADAGYQYRCGWIRDGRQMWTWTKRFPLTVATWAASL